MRKKLIQPSSRSRRGHADESADGMHPATGGHVLLATACDRDRAILVLWPVRAYYCPILRIIVSGVGCPVLGESVVLTD